MGQNEQERRRRFNRLYESNFDAILSYARLRSKTAQDADDVVAETFMTAWRRVEDLPDDEPVARLWIFATARRTLANHHRGNRRKRSLVERIAGERFSSQTHQAEHLDSPLEAALEQLSEGQRELLKLAYWEELDPGEIAAVLGCSRNAVRIRLHRARRALADALGMDADQQPDFNERRTPTIGEETAG